MLADTSKSWIHPPKYVQAAILISLGGALFGLDTGTIGPITAMPQFDVTFGRLSATIHGLVVSTILIPAAASSFFGGHLANAVGRPRATAIGAGIFGIGAAVECASVKLAMLFVGRAVKGIGEGLFLSTLVVYITEISPPRSRGTLASIPQLLTTIGLCAGYFICYGTTNVQSSIAWRLPFAIQAGCSFIFVISTLLLLPQSPRWLSASGRHKEAAACWERLGVQAAEREKLQENAQEGLAEQVKLKDILAVFHRNVWKQTSLGVFLMGMQQLSGIDGVLYYAPLLFQSAGLTSSTASFLASGVSAILIMLVTIPAFLYADRWGRKTSCVVGGLLMSVCMLTIGSLYASGSVHASHGSARWVVIVMIYLFAIIFSATWAVGFRVYVSEIQPNKTRAGATSLSLSANWIVNWIVAFTTPIFLAQSSFGVYFLFGGSLVVTVAVCVFVMPETSGRSLEDISSSFGKKLPLGDVEELVSLENRPYRTADGKAANTRIIAASSSSSVY
ncbi:hypothetical protein PVAG01_11120 [Phlyctema vagabunda]|uniref:Major facilitator superfamily (MFS) profile domain-containing protein n=1 Tax=Phlyctema vagabunda TaxID=108571 RepID=A0ABR4P1E4_9HELO